MTMHSGKDILRVLWMSNYDVAGMTPENLDWLFQCEQTEFLEWMCQYVGPENMLQEDEVEEYEKWVANNTLHFDHSHNDTSVGQTCLGNINDELIVDASVGQTCPENLKDELIVVDELNSCLKKYQDMLRSELNPSEEQLHQVEKNTFLADCELRVVQAKCEKLCNKLDSTRLKLVGAIEAAASCFLDVHDSSMFPHNLGQVPLADLKKQIDTCDHLITTIMRKHTFENMVHHEVDQKQQFMQQFFSGDNCNLDLVFGQNKESLKNSLNEFCFVQQSLTEINIENWAASIEEQADLAAIDMLKLLATNVNSSQLYISQPQLKYQLKELTLVAASLEKHNSELMDEAMTDVERISQSYMMKVLANDHRVIEVVQEHSLVRMAMVGKLVGAQLQHDDLLWLLFDYEKTYIQAIAELTDIYYGNIKKSFSQLTKRREIMTSIQEAYSAYLRKPLCVQNNLCNALKMSFADGVDVPISTFPESLYQLNSDVASKEQIILDTLKESKRIVHQNSMLRNQLKNLALSGATKKPVIVHADISVLLHQLQMQADGLDSTLHDMLNDFVNRKVLLLKSPPLADKRLLWVYFLVNNEMLVQVLQKLCLQVANKSPGVAAIKYN